MGTYDDWIRLQDDAHRVMNERQDGQNMRDWCARSLEFWKRFDDSMLTAQMWITTLDEDVQRELTRAPQPQTLSEAMEMAVRFAGILSREKEHETDKERGRKRADRRNPTLTEQTATRKRKRQRSSTGPSFSKIRRHRRQRPEGPR
ncbi:hypothetical protein NYO67_2208 [Aspergillus flavus]|nr:hypothetical protein NYO67_2208 [Aspergillus flavus]